MKTGLAIFLFVCVCISMFYVGRLTKICPSEPEKTYADTLRKIDSVIIEREFSIDTLLWQMKQRDKELMFLLKKYETDTVFIVERPVYSVSELSRKLTERAERYDTLSRR